MESQIVIDLSARHAVIVQLANSRRGVRTVDAALATAADFPDSWNEGNSSATVATLPVVSPQQRRARAIANARLLAPALTGYRAICMLPDSEYEYRVESAGQAAIESSLQGTPEASAQINHSYWVRAPFPADATALRRLSVGLKIGVHRDAVKETRRILAAHSWDLESIVSPASVVSRADAIEEGSLGISLVDGSDNIRFVLHHAGLPIFVRRLRLPWLKPSSEYSGLSPSEWWRPAYAALHPRDRIMEIASEFSRTMQYIHRRCQLPIKRVKIHGPLGIDRRAIDVIASVSTAQVSSAELPDGVRWLPGMQEAAPLYSLATQAAVQAMEAP